MKRGLTLIEVLVSLALLTLIATTTIPFMRAALAVLHKDDEILIQPSHADLAELADTFMVEPESFDIRVADIAAGLDAFTVASPEHPEWGSVEVRVRRGGNVIEPDADRSVWLVFTDPGERWAVSRWLRLPKDTTP